MRITLSLDEVLRQQHDYPSPDYVGSYFNGGIIRMTGHPTLTIETVAGTLEFKRDWKMFVYERTEYRPDWRPEESEQEFRIEHDIPLGAKGKKVEKKNKLIKTSGYDVYQWTWIVVCTTEADIVAEQKYIEEMGKR